MRARANERTHARTVRYDLAHLRRAAHSADLSALNGPTNVKRRQAVGYLRLDGDLMDFLIGRSHAHRYAVRSVRDAVRSTCCER